MFLLIFITSFYKGLKLKEIYNQGFDPGGCHHVIYVVAFLEAPEVRDFSETETHNIFVGSQKGVHISMQALQGIDSCEIEFHLDEIIWVGYRS